MEQKYLNFFKLLKFLKPKSKIHEFFCNNFFYWLKIKLVFTFLSKKFKIKLIFELLKYFFLLYVFDDLSFNFKNELDKKLKQQRALNIKL